MTARATGVKRRVSPAAPLIDMESKAATKSCLSALFTNARDQKPAPIVASFRLTPQLQLNRIRAIYASIAPGRAERAGRHADPSSSTTPTLTGLTVNALRCDALTDDRPAFGGRMGLFC